jgi:phosphoribosylformimino-5-aminoimidazole carboxamide ribotide isomerase
MSLLLIPAIDLKDGQCVRLRQGDLNDATVFSGNPGEQAAHWVAQGARRIHIVDLNGAVAGKPKNEAAIKAIIRAAGPDVPVQVGGGIRDLDTIERFLDDGASFVVIGTAAVKNPGLLKDACAAFPGQIIVSIDAKDGKVATDGWSKLSGHEVIDLAQKFEDDGVSAVLYTDIGRDGMMTGVNLEATVRLAQAVNIPIIASGGIAGLQDIKDLAAVESEGIMGAILGRALYEGKLDLGEAQAYADQADAAGAADGS